jgi:hypothetical protein
LKGKKNVLSIRKRSAVAFSAKRPPSSSIMIAAPVQEVISNSIISVRVFIVSVHGHCATFLRQPSQALLPPGSPFTVIQQKQSRSEQAQPAQDRESPPDTDDVYQVLQKRDRDSGEGTADDVAGSLGCRWCTMIFVAEEGVVYLVFLLELS